MHKKRILSLITVMAMLSAFSAPAFADTETSVPEVSAVDAAETTEPDDSAQEAEDTSEDCGEADMLGEAEDSAEPEDNITYTEESDTLTEDDEEYLAGDWYEWNSSTGVLTVRNQLPNTSSSGNHNLAYYAGVESTKVNKIVIKNETKAGTSTNGMFYNMQNLKIIEGLDCLDTSNVTDMTRMFYNCSKLKKFDLSCLDTSKVTVMDSMFRQMDSVSYLDLTSFDTSKVTDMWYMFEGCDNLSLITVSDKWTAAYASDSEDVFTDCKKLTGYKGTEYNSSRTDIAYAHLDGGTSNPGYLSKKWYDWDESSGTLTLRNKLPDTSYYYDGYDDYFRNLAYYTYAGIKQTDIKKIIVESGTKAGSSAYYMFEGMSSLTSIEGLYNLDTSSTTNMAFMFSDCSALTSLDLSGFDTEKATDLSVMFSGCSLLKTLDLSSFDTSNVTGMNYMFSECSSLTMIMVSDKWDTSKVYTPDGMFHGCAALKGGAGTVFNSSEIGIDYAHIDGGTSDPGYLTDVKTAFSYVDDYKTLHLVGEFNGTNANNTIDKALERAGKSRTGIYRIVAEDGAVFPENCNQLFDSFTYVYEMDLEKADTSHIKNMQNMFAWCKSLQDLDLSSFDTSNVEDMSAMFYACESLKTVDMSGFDTSNVTTMAIMFCGCKALTEPVLSSFDTSKTETMMNMFQLCTSLTSLDLSSFDTSKLNTMHGMFQSCENLKTITVSDKWTTAAVGYNGGDGMFYNCTSLVGGEGTVYNSSKTDESYAHIDGGTSNPGYLTEKWYTWDESTGTLTVQGQLPNTCYESETVKNLAYFAGIGSADIKKIVVTSGTKTGTRADSMFADMNNVTEIQGLSNLDTSKATTMVSMFAGLFNLTSLDLSKLDTSNVTDMTTMFAGCSAPLDLSGMDTSKVTSMSGMFNGSCMESIVLSGKFSTANAKKLSGMFAGCNKLKTLDLSGLDTSKVTNMHGMFYSCNELQTITVSDKWNITAVTDSFDMFKSCTKLKGGAGTVFNSSKTDKEYAHIDGGASNPGYLTAAPVAATGITLNKTSLTLTVGQSATLIATVTPANATNKTVTWTSDKTSVATVSKGKITAVAPGTAKITAKTANGKTAVCTVTVEQAAPDKPTVVIHTAFGGKTVQFNCTDPDAEIYYQTSSSNITLSSNHVKAGTTVFFNKPMTGAEAAIYFKAYKNGKWSVVGKWGLLNVKIAQPIIKQSGKKADNNFRIYTQTEKSYMVYTLDGSVPAIQEGSSLLKVTNGRLVWGTSTVVNIPKGKTLKVIAIRNGLVTSDVLEYTNE